MIRCRGACELDHAAQTHPRIDEHGDASGIEDAEEGCVEVDRHGQHQHHAAACVDALHALPQIAERDRAPAFVKRDPLRMRACGVAEERGCVHSV
jgi:hypothetical protein